MVFYPSARFSVTGNARVSWAFVTAGITHREAFSSPLRKYDRAITSGYSLREVCARLVTGCVIKDYHKITGLNEIIY